ncbi:low affinity immunoglobulin epsilon Fc receptor-like protein, partial [Leptotrombidium deliense]
LLVNVNACPQDWTAFQDKCFFIDESMATARENFELCKSLNASMVSIHSMAENNFLSTLLLSKLSNRGSRMRKGSSSFWLGGLQVSQTMNAFAWIDSSDFNFTNYGRNDPNNFDDEEDCVMLVLRMRGKWWDEHCSARSRQLCQIKENNVSIPEHFSIHFSDVIVDNQIKARKSIITINEKINAARETSSKVMDTIRSTVKESVTNKLRKCEEASRRLTVAENSTNIQINETFVNSVQKIKANDEKFNKLKEAFEILMWPTKQKMMKFSSAVDIKQVTIKMQARKISKSERDFDFSTKRMKNEVATQIMLFQDTIASVKETLNLCKRRIIDVTSFSDDNFLMHDMNVTEIRVNSEDSLSSIENELNDVDNQVIILTVFFALTVLCCTLMSVDLLLLRLKRRNGFHKLKTESYDFE